MTAPIADTKPRRPMPPGRGSVLEIEKPLLEDTTSTKSVPENDKPDKPFVYRPGALVKPLEALYETLGGFVLLADRVCGQAIIDSAHSCAESLDELARTNAKVRKVLVNLVTTGTLTKVIVAHLPLLMAVLGHHFPKALTHIMSFMMGVKDPE